MFSFETLWFKTWYYEGLFLGYIWLYSLFLSIWSCVLKSLILPHICVRLALHRERLVFFSLPLSWKTSFRCFSSTCGIFGVKVHKMMLNERASRRRVLKRRGFSSRLPGLPLCPLISPSSWSSAEVLAAGWRVISIADERADNSAGYLSHGLHSNKQLNASPSCLYTINSWNSFLHNSAALVLLLVLSGCMLSLCGAVPVLDFLCGSCWLLACPHVSSSLEITLSGKPARRLPAVRLSRGVDSSSRPSNPPLFSCLEPPPGIQFTVTYVVCAGDEHSDEKTLQQLVACVHFIVICCSFVPINTNRFLLQSRRSICSCNNTGYLVQKQFKA